MLNIGRISFSINNYMSFKEFYIKENETDFHFNYFKSLSNYSKQNMYAKSKLTKIGAGSSRIVYEYNDNVIKIAKNKKGIAQNNVESDKGIHDMYSSILPKLIDYDKDNNWVILKKAKKITKKRFEELSKLTYEQYCSLLDKFRQSKTGKRLSDEDSEILYADDTFLSELISMSINFGFAVNDFKKFTSLGEINNKIVVVDFGFTETVYTTHYKGK